ncbi:MAG: hypothetical protein ACREUT_19565 [Steroidobacteraceae bacterium]
MSRALILSAALAALAFGSARAADPSAPSNPGSSASETPQEVTVTAQRAKLAKRVTAFVGRITGPLFEGGLARWGVPVCPLVSGVTPEDSEFILKRVSEIARAARVPLARGQCQRNLYVLVTTRPPELLKTLAEPSNLRFTFGFDASPGLLPIMQGIAGFPTTGLAAPSIVLQEFISTPGPARVLYRDAPYGRADSHPMVSAAKVGPITYSEDTWEYHSAPWYVFRVFVIIDASQLKGVSLGQFASYVAMVGLAEIKPADTLADAPTILKLFAGDPHAAPAGITDWDQAFLKSVYATPLSSSQRYWIGRAMVKDIVH